MAKLVWSVSEFLLVVLAWCIWVASVSLAAASGFTAMVATTLLPVLSQAYWIKSVSAATGKVPEPLTALCLIWIGLLVVWVYARHWAIARHVAAAEKSASR